MAWRRPGDKPLSEPMVGSLLTHKCVTRPQWVKSMALEGFEWSFRSVIFKPILMIGGWGIACEIALRWMSLDFTDDKSTLIQVMAWCRQAASHYLSLWFMLPYGTTKPQWVKQCYNINLLVMYLQSNSAHTRFSFWAGIGIGWLSLPKALMIYLLRAGICIWHVPQHTQRCVLSEFSWHQIYEPFQGTTSVAPGKYCLSRTSNMCILGKQNRFSMPTKEIANKSLNFWSEGLCLTSFLRYKGQ